ncbi:MAG TPA: RNA 2',3'-cyclic phosphodiesterase, partial [Dehalococcoidia bacterium]|nr:RNA 2',3'-cyclic phosphodiesterase [Dehalococcoidia bacterium]
MPAMIIDFHTHIFPPDVRGQRDEYLRRDPTFAEMYVSPKAKIATAEDLLRSMDEARVEVSVALGFAWREHDMCVRHNDYLLESAAESGGRIVPFCTVNMTAAGGESEIERCAQAGARGLGELRPESQGWDLNGEPGERLAALAERLGLILLFHVTEPAGHDYPGKEGLRLESFRRFCLKGPGVPIVGAHLAGGLPFHAATPEASQGLARVYLDTAAQPLLYDRGVYGQVVAVAGTERLLLGSDYPLIEQKRQIEEVRAGIADEESLRLVLGGNAARLLGWPARNRGVPEILRLFVAVELGEGVRRALAALQDDLRRRGLTDLRWVRPEGIHLTLKFLGETPTEKVADIQEALAAEVAGVAPHWLRLGKLGTFGDRRGPQVLWVDLEGDVSRLAQLQRRIDQALAPLGFPRERREFAPHLTLARV